MGRAWTTWWAFALGMTLIAVSIVIILTTEKNRHVENSYWRGIYTSVRHAQKSDLLVYALQWTGIVIVAVWGEYRRRRSRAA
jgi:hypothetical protein